MRLILIPIICSFCYFPVWSQNERDLFDEGHSLRYAQYLQESRQFASAAREYERVLFFRRDDSLIQQNLLDSYLRANQFEKGLQRAQQLYPQSQKMSGGLAFTYGKLLLRNGNHLQLSGFLNANSSLKNQDLALLQIGNALISKDWTQAQTGFEKYQQLPGITSTYGSLIVRSKQLQHKSPLLASSLSLVVPGLGKVYTGQWKDGIISLITVGSLVYTAWRSYNRDGFESPFFWIYGGIGMGFYLGNIYGSWQSALRFNNFQNDQLVHDTEAVLYPRL